MTSDQEDARQPDQTPGVRLTRVIDRSSATRLVEQMQRNSAIHALHAAQQHPSIAAMRDIESPATRFAIELANSDVLRMSSGIRQNLADRMGQLNEHAGMARRSAMALRQSLMPWQPVVSELAIAASRTANDILAWRDRYARQRDAAVEAMRRLHSSIGPVRRLAEQFGEQLHVAAQLSQSPAFQSWLSEMSSVEMQERMEQLLQEASEDTSASSPDMATPPAAMQATAASLVSWLVGCLAALRSSGLPHADRMVLYGYALTIACFLYTEIGSNQDHAEHMAKIDAQSQAMNAKLDEQNRSGHQMVALNQAMLDLEMADHTYLVIVRSAPFRAELSEPATHWLSYGEEVQVLRAAGKWRLVQTVDDEGALRFGWVLNKHLKRLTEPD
ncbi:SH3 domain-containing protein [Stenotrophomonas bentonitica]